MVVALYFEEFSMKIKLGPDSFVGSYRCCFVEILANFYNE